MSDMSVLSYLTYGYYFNMKTVTTYSELHIVCRRMNLEVFVALKWLIFVPQTCVC